MQHDWKISVVGSCYLVCRRCGVSDLEVETIGPAECPVIERARPSDDGELERLPKVHSVAHCS
jgi:hypothetical protein